MKTNEVTREIERDIPFYESSGGDVTFSGGGPLLQIDFLKTLLLESKKHNLHITIDTARNVPWHVFKEILPYVDLFLYDIKSIDNERHRIWTGIGNINILNNLTRLSVNDAVIRVRIPVIAGFNDTINEMVKIADTLWEIGKADSIELLPYHRLGEGKYKSFGMKYKYKGIPPKESLIDEFMKIFREKGFKVEEN